VSPSILVPAAALMAALGAMYAPPATAETDPATAKQARDPASSEWLFREGRNLMKKGDFAPACAKLAESLRLDPAVGTLMNLAGCEERLGRSASAWQRWSAAADQLPPTDKRRATALTRARALERSLARLTINVGPSTPATAEVRRDDVPLGAASLGVPLPVDPGAHSIVLTAAGREGREVEVVVSPAEQKVITVEPGAVTPRSSFQAPVVPAVVRVAPPPFTPPANAPVAPPSGLASSSLSASASLAQTPGLAAQAPPPAAPPSRTPLLGYVLTGSGVAVLGAGVVFGAEALAARNEAQEACRQADRRCWSRTSMAVDRDRRWSVVAGVALATGAVATATGLYFWLRPHSFPTTMARLVPAPQGGKVELAGRF
jgi:hypothetical protein